MKRELYSFQNKVWPLKGEKSQTITKNDKISFIRCLKCEKYLEKCPKKPMKASKNVDLVH